MKIKRNGRTVSRFDGITTHIGHSFMVMAAREEAKQRRDCREVVVEGGELSGRSTARLVGHDGGTLATYSQAW